MRLYIGSGDESAMTQVQVESVLPTGASLHGTADTLRWRLETTRLQRGQTW